MQGKVSEKQGKTVASVRAADGSVWLERFRKIVLETIFVGVGWLLGQSQIFFGTYPLGLAFLCATEKHVLSTLIGLLISAIAQDTIPVVYICTYIAAALVRGVAGLVLEHPDAHITTVAGVKKKQSEGTGVRSEDGERGGFADAFCAMFTESICLRMATGAVCAFIIALARVLVGGFHYYDAIAMVFTLAFTPLAVLIFSVSLDTKVSHAVLRALSEAALLFALVWSAREITLLGFSLCAILAFLFTLYACATRGSVLGTVAAILCGLAFDPIQIPSFLLAALIFSLLRGRGKEGAGTLCACFALLLWSTYVRGAAILLTLLPACLLAGTVFTLIRKWESITSVSEPKEAEKHRHGERLRIADARCQDSGERFRAISEAFTSLSEMFYNLSDRFRRPGTLDLRRICDTSFDAFCANCPNKTVCWGLEYTATLGTVNALISQLHTKGKVSREQIPSAMIHRCDTMDSILDKINADCARLTGEMLRNNRTEIFAMDYESAASIINDALEEDDGEYRFDPELEQKVKEYLGDAGVRAGSVTVYGNRRRQIVVRGANVEQAKVTAETLRADLGEMCGLELGKPIFEVEGNVNVMSLRARKKISVQGAQNNVSADGGVSGDSVNLFSNRQDYFYALISDGMGAGKEAALTSGLCSVFLEKMLRAGNRAGTSLRMLNNMIRSREADSVRECSSTVDLLELDLMTAEASFIKSGAAPSFVVRAGVVHRLQAGTAPIGIIRTLDAQATPFSLRVGDTVVLISDGILQNDPDCEWISSYLTGASDLTPEELVYRICVYAAGFDDHDDCSAIALRILPADEEMSA